MSTVIKCLVIYGIIVVIGYSLGGLIWDEFKYQKPSSDWYWPTKQEDLRAFYDKCDVKSTDLMIPSFHKLAVCLEDRCGR